MVIYEINYPHEYKKRLQQFLLRSHTLSVGSTRKVDYCLMHQTQSRTHLTTIYVWWTLTTYTHCLSEILALFQYLALSPLLGDSMPLDFWSSQVYLAQYNYSYCVLSVFLVGSPMMTRICWIRWYKSKINCVNMTHSFGRSIQTEALVTVIRPIAEFSFHDDYFCDVESLDCRFEFKFVFSMLSQSAYLWLMLCSHNSDTRPRDGTR